MAINLTSERLVLYNFPRVKVAIWIINLTSERLVLYNRHDG